MARKPVTRVQLDAYRFGQRRMESALARRDPVLLHEEIRGQRRVVATGLALAVLALVGAFGYAKLSGRTAWDQQQVVAAKQSGRLYAVIHKPEAVLVPVGNLAAARLVLAAVARATGGRGAAGDAEPVPIDDAALDRAPRTAAAAVPGAAALLPAAGEAPPRVGPWAVCDTADRTLVVAGATEPRRLSRGQALLLRAPSRELYLVTGDRRHRLADEPAALRAYDLVDAPQRPASAALLDAIAEGRPVRVPAVPGAGGAGPDGLPARVGEVVRVPSGGGGRDGGAGRDPAAGGGSRYYLVLAGGVQEVPEPVANLVRTGPGFDPAEAPPEVRAEQLNALPRSTLAGLDQYPGVLPAVAGGRSVCWHWGVDGRGGTLSVADAPPVADGRPVTVLARADGERPGVDAVSMPTGTATVVRAVNGRDGAGGGLWLVSDTGVGYLVAAGQEAGNETATALGIQPEQAGPAPEQALRLLPAGPVLDLQAALHTVDVLVAPGMDG